MIKQMTRNEKERLCSVDFNKLWKDIWGNSKYSNQYKSEEIISREKYNMLLVGIYDYLQQDVGQNGVVSEAISDYGEKCTNFEGQSPMVDAPMVREQSSPLIQQNPKVEDLRILAHVPEKSQQKIVSIPKYTLQSLIKESEQFDSWEEPEWGFPKGRRNNQENDFDCALREFTEETGYHSTSLVYIQNVLPFEEIFLGSNYKSYKHKYFLMNMDYQTSLEMGKYQTSEVSKIEWKSCEDCIACFRPYNLEKIRILTNIHRGIMSRHIIPS